MAMAKKTYKARDKVRKVLSDIGLAPKPAPTQQPPIDVQAGYKGNPNNPPEIKTANKPATSIKFNQDKSVSANVTGRSFNEGFELTEQQYKDAQAGIPSDETVRRYLSAREISANDAREQQAVDAENLKRNIQGLPPLRTPEEIKALMDSLGDTRGIKTDVSAGDINTRGIVGSAVAKGAIGAAGGAAAGAFAGGVGAVPGAVIGALGGVGLGIFGGFSKEKKQQVSNIGTDFSVTRSSLNSIISATNKGADPVLMAAEFNQRVAEIEDMELILKEITDGDLEEFLGDPGNELIKINQWQEDKQIYIQRMKLALQNPNPNLIEVAE